MSLTLKRDPEWLETLHQADADQALALLIGDDGCQISVPVTILVAMSPLVRSISAVLLPPAISPVALSVPGVAGDVLRIVVEMIMKGTSYGLNPEQIQKVYEVFELLEFGAVLNSYNPESCEIIVELKYENAIEAFEMGAAGVSSKNASEVEEENNFSVKDKDIKVELNIKSEKLESTPLLDRKANRKKKIRNMSYVCDQCDFKGSDISQLRRHNRIHTGEKPFACDQCEYKANHSNNLVRHKRTHTGEKPFSCDQCKYKAKQLISLINHQKIVHTGEKHKIIHAVVKPYECDQCDYKCTVKARLLRHKELIHKVDCELCEYKAKNRHELINHKRTHYT